MTPDETKRLVQLVAGLCEAFARTPSQATFMAYELGLDDLPMAAIEVAVKRALRESRYMPSPAELRELAGEPTTNDRATLAWDCVLKNVHLGPYKHVSFVDDRIINATIRNLGGWPRFLSRFKSADDEKWIRKEFIETYRVLHNARVDGEICLPLAGLSGGSFSDGRDFVPAVTQVRTNLPALPAPARKSAAERFDAGIPRVEFSKVPQ